MSFCYLYHESATLGESSHRPPPHFAKSQIAEIVHRSHRERQRGTTLPSGSNRESGFLDSRREFGPSAPISQLPRSSRILNPHFFLIRLVMRPHACVLRKIVPLTLSHFPSHSHPGFPTLQGYLAQKKVPRPTQAADQIATQRGGAAFRRTVGCPRRLPLARGRDGEGHG